MRPFIIIILVALTLSACGSAARTPGPCEVEAVQAASVAFRDIITQWQDAYKIANSTARISLSAPVSAMQSLRRQATNITVPPCLDNAKRNLTDSMDETINGFLAFMAQKHESVVSSHFDNAQAQLEQFTTKLQTVIACAPDCK